MGKSRYLKIGLVLFMTAFGICVLLIVFQNKSPEELTIGLEESTAVKTSFDHNSKFIYTLQSVVYEDLAAVDFDIGVVDPDESRLTAQQIDLLHSQDKTLIAYLSIGEAEDYRDYWKSGWKTGSPAFLDEENPDWVGNYKVRYWQEDWQEIIAGKLDDIIALGFDGVYLDIVDAYEYYEDLKFESAREDMVKFVVLLSKQAKLQNPGFLIIPQNAVELIEDKRYFDAIDGLGKEDTWYIDNESQEGKTLIYELQFLDLLISKSKFVLAIDYPTEKEKQCYFLKIAGEHKFAAFVSNRELDQIEDIDCSGIVTF